MSYYTAGLKTRRYHDGTASYNQHSYEHDESWTRLDEIADRDRRRAEIQGFVSNRLLASPDTSLRS